MNNRIYLFGGISFTMVVGAIIFYAYSLAMFTKMPAPQTTIEPAPLVTLSIPKIVTPAEPHVKPMITVTTPISNAVIKSPLYIFGEAKGMWYFEGSFPIELQDALGKTMATGIATSTGEWMTEEFVPFKSTLTWASTTATSGMLILRRDNPSGLPENDDSIRIPVIF